MSDDLRCVPEVAFQARRPVVDLKSDFDLEIQATARQLAKITYLNTKQRDQFMHLLLANRPDLAGLPFEMGDVCRVTDEHARLFKRAVDHFRTAMSVADSNPDRGTFWGHYYAQSGFPDSLNRAAVEQLKAARVAALMQIVPTEKPELQRGLVVYLGSESRVEATKALARLAIFSTQQEVREEAVAALKQRGREDYSDILSAGLRYPFPPVAKRAAEAIVRLQRKDLVPQLVAVINEDDPRLPRLKNLGGKRSLVVRELVKLNHHRNCMLCHAPASSGLKSGGVAGVVPIEGLPLSRDRYDLSGPDTSLSVRVDVTYLRQDFSTLLPMVGFAPLPDAQRFDFLVRERPVSHDEAAAFTKLLTPRAGELSPYHEAAATALRQLTGSATSPLGVDR